ncbi:MAG: formate dehydrogenase accessory sulfurtransferase FdhD [Acidiferrobacter sp.]
MRTGTDCRRVGWSPAVVRQSDGQAFEREDSILEETPLSVVINGKPYAVMMMTPGHIEDFLFGFLFAEGLIEESTDVFAWETQETADGYGVYVQLSGEAAGRAQERTRAVVGVSACGLCGIPRFDGLLRLGGFLAHKDRVSADRIQEVLRQMQTQQRLNESTGTAHAAIIVGPDDWVVREDIGRHNAVDKAAGWAIRQGWDREGLVLLGVSSRLTFEIVQKALRLRIPVIAAISGVSSMAIRVAERHGITVIGYAREGRMSIYTHRETMTLTAHGEIDR